MRPFPARVLVASQSPATQSLLNTMLSGFFVNSVGSIEEVQQYIYESRVANPGLDFIILDEQCLKDNRPQNIKTLKCKSNTKATQRIATDQSYSI